MTANNSGAAPAPELCRCGHPLDAHSGTSVSGLPCRTCATRQLPPQRRCYGWAPTGPRPALSYGCTCPGGDQHDPDNAGCRYGQVAAVRPMADPPDLDQAIQAAEQALRRVQPQGHWPDVARVAVEAAWPYAIGSANQHHWKRMATNNMRALQATRDRLATLHANLQDAHYNLATAKSALSGLRRLKLNREARECANIAHEAVQLADTAAVLDVAAAQENPQ